jgi:ferric-dicitrate binding protein FerR (iron transport regulator)
MKTESLHSLLIDHHFGELTPEAVELLEHHLATHSEARLEAERLLATLTVTRTAVQQHPELAHVPATTTPTPRPRHQHWLARAAAIIALAGSAGMGGYLVGRGNPPPPVATTTPRTGSPWAKYRMSFDPAGAGIQVLRVDTAPSPASLR